MERRNGFLTFLCALIPGVGYMYLGLTNIGIETFLVFLLIKPVFNILGLTSIGHILATVIWFYAFFDTFSTAHKLDRGEVIIDKGFILKKYDKMHNSKNENAECTDENNIKKFNNSKKNMNIIAYLLIAFGILAILNKIFDNSSIFSMLKSSINIYFLPSLFIVAGVYLLYKK